MVCMRCNSFSCSCTQGFINQMAAAQMNQQQYMAYLQEHYSRSNPVDINKDSHEQKNNKKLLLLRK